VLPQPQEPIGNADLRDARSNLLDVENHRASTVRMLRHFCALTIQAFVLIGLLSLFFLRVPQVDGHSMAPQIDAGDHVVINTLAYDMRVDRPGGGEEPVADVHLRPIARGDVVAFVHGTGDDKRIYLKRVIGLPGDTVSIERGVVAVNGATLVETYIARTDAADMSAEQVPANSIFVLGDNRGDSDDSRSFGPVPATAIVGRAALIIWPPNRVRSIR
jgi:signal peptidase I